MRLRPVPLLLVCVGLLAPAALRAWDAEGHKIVNQLALAALPPDFPAFARTPAAAERIAFLANVPDRWRNVDPALRQLGGSWTDHYCDLEYLTEAGLDPRTVPSLRLDFALIFAAGRIANSGKFLAIDPAKNADHTREWPGFSPWAMAEWFHKLRSAFAYLKAYEEVGGTPEEIANSQADVIYVMGVIGHYVGDGAQPLHTTKHFNGWSGDNPNGYSTWPGFHSWIDGGFALKARLKAADLLPRVTTAKPLSLPARPDGRDPFFVAAMDYLLAQHQLVEPLYRLEKAAKLGHGEQPITDEARAFVGGQLLVGGDMLARVWVTAWRNAPVDTYLRTQLGKRQQAPAAKPAAP
ncbi:MAG: hypothetical protein RLZZ15_369 [Verrucomicrobiota bacterium]|jgi:hypothetical protein